MKHLCDDVCFKKFRSNPTEYLRQATPAGTGNQPKTAENKTSPPATPAANQNQQKQTQGAPPPVSSTFNHTVKPVLRGHPREARCLTAKDRWPLNTGSFALYLASREPKNIPLIEVTT